MIKNIIITISLLLISCSKDKHKIEIYTSPYRFNNLEGIQLSKHFENEIKNDADFLRKFGANTTFDTLNNDIIFAGKFNFVSTKLNKEPTISDEEILMLDLDKNEIIFSESGRKQLSKLKGSLYGIQFIMTDNKKPIMTGYLWNDFSPYWSNWNTISYSTDFNKKKKNRIFKGIGRQDLLGQPINFSNYTDLLIAFKESNRLKEKASR